MDRVTNQDHGNGSQTEKEFGCAIVGERPYLVRRAFFLTRDRDSALDLVQTTLERACRSRHQFRVGSSARSWLHTIMTSCFVDEMRRRKVQPFSRSAVEWDVAAPIPDEIPVWSDLGIDDVKAVTRRLPPAFRQPFELRVFDRLSYRAIGDRLNLPMGTIATRIFRAKRALRDMLIEGLAN